MPPYEHKKTRAGGGCSMRRRCCTGGGWVASVVGEGGENYPIRHSLCESLGCVRVGLSLSTRLFLPLNAFFVFQVRRHGGNDLREGFIFLLPGDEHEAAGGAPRHRVRHGGRPRRAGKDKTMKGRSRKTKRAVEAFSSDTAVLLCHPSFQGFFVANNRFQSRQRNRERTT